MQYEGGSKGQKLPHFLNSGSPPESFPSGGQSHGGRHVRNHSPFFCAVRCLPFCRGELRCAGLAAYRKRAARDKAGRWSRTDGGEGESAGHGSARGCFSRTRGSRREFSQGLFVG